MRKLCENVREFHFFKERLMSKEAMKRIAYLIVVFCITTNFCFAQNTSIRVGGESFEFKNGVEEWSEPVVFDLKFKGKKGMDDSVPLSIRLKVKKRFVLACHYYVEIENLSGRKVEFVYSNQYRDFQYNPILKTAKIGKGKKFKGLVVYGEKGFKPKGKESCLECSWYFEFYNVKAK